MAIMVERARRDSSGDRMLAVLELFTVERPQWTVEAAAERIGVSATTTYRYFKRLTGAGLISPIAGASYALGPAIVQMDRLIQICDPMLRAARLVMTRAWSSGPPRARRSCSAACFTTASCASIWWWVGDRSRR